MKDKTSQLGSTWDHRTTYFFKELRKIMLVFFHPFSRHKQMRHNYLDQTLKIPLKASIKFRFAS